MNRKQLKHNKDLYEKHGIQKSIFGSIGQKDFANPAPSEIPWLDGADGLNRLEANPSFNSFPIETQEAIRHFIKNGYLILKGFYSEEECAALNTEVDKLLKNSRADFNYTGKKIMNAYEQSTLINQQYFKSPRLLEILNFIMGKEVVPFQTINFIQGSEQKAHSDSIHMSTQPLGYLIASWTALEDIDQESGPLFYYPGSHRFPYVSCEDYASGNTTWRIGANSYKKYEEYIDNLIREKKLKKEYFLAQKGDVLLWHANLLHGGDPIANEEATRKSMVAHYFCKDVICYHEITQRPALIKP